MNGKFTVAATAKEFILSGAALITLVSQQTEARYTFKIQDGDNIHFVKLLTGRDVFTYLGVIRNDVFTLTRKSSMHELSTPYRAFLHMWRWLVEADAIAPKLEIWHNGKCGRCGRPLTVPASIERGFGPECQEIIDREKGL